jgi:hypothetical protein
MTDIVDCPICGQHVHHSKINQHIDSNCSDHTYGREQKRLHKPFSVPRANSNTGRLTNPFETTGPGVEAEIFDVTRQSSPNETQSKTVSKHLHPTKNKFEALTESTQANRGVNVAGAAARYAGFQNASMLPASTVASTLGAPAAAGRPELARQEPAKKTQKPKKQAQSKGQQSLSAFFKCGETAALGSEEIPASNSSRSSIAAEPGRAMGCTLSVGSGGSAAAAAEPDNDGGANPEISTNSDPLVTALCSSFGFRSFRTSEQRQAVEAVLEGRDVFVMMPTGAGKSLCFQLPAIVRSQAAGGAMAVVISPLIALMSTQVAALKAKGISAGLINSSCSVAEKAAMWVRLRSMLAKTAPSNPTGSNRAATKGVVLLHVTPEFLHNSEFQQYLQNMCRLGRLSLCPGPAGAVKRP